MSDCVELAPLQPLEEKRDKEREGGDEGVSGRDEVYPPNWGSDGSGDDAGISGFGETHCV
jgi:hypothetical protein